MSRLIRVGAVVSILLSLAIAWVVAGDVHGRVGRPDPGFVFYQNAVVGPPYLAGVDAPRVPGLRLMDRITAVEGRPVQGAADIWGAVEAVPPGTLLRYEIERATGARFEVAVATRTFTEREYWNLELPFLLGGLLLLAVGALPVLVRPELPTARVFFVFSIAWVTNFCFLAIDYFHVYRFMPWSYAASFLAKASLLHLALIFPERRWPLTRRPRLALALLYGVLAVLSVAWVVAMRRAPAALYWLDLLALPTFLGGLVLLTVNLARTALRSPDALQRQRARVVLAGPALAFVAWALAMATAWGWADFGLTAVGLVLPVSSLPLAIAYGMLKHNLFEFNATVRRAITFGAFVLVAALTYLGAFVAVERIAGPGAAWLSAAVTAAVVAALVPAVEPLRRRVQDAVDEILFPGYRRAALAVHRASRALAHLDDAPGVARRLREAAAECAPGASFRLLAGAPEGSLVELDASAPAGALALDPSDPLAAALRRGETLNLDTRSRPGARLSPLERRIDDLAMRLVVTLPPSARLVGGFLLGPRADGRLYTSDDERLLETLAAQSSVAIENARAWQEVQSLQQRLAEENLCLRQEIRIAHGFEEIVGESPAIKAVLAQIEQVAAADVTVLVMGETGTGKELAVRALHAHSRRAERTLVKVACAAIPESLLESELFGHERGAFTGASERRRGRFELADGGTLFLDDVDTLPLAIQAKLLRAIQEGEIQRLGSAEVRRVDLRIIATTNKDLLAEVRAGRFREDLYYRLNVVPIHLPPLRERREDIPLLVHAVVARESARLGRTVAALGADVLPQMQAYAWPGNVRELRNVVERALVMASGDVLRLADPLVPPASSAAAPLAGGYAEMVRAYKASLIQGALRAAGGNRSRAAALLGLHRPSLVRMISELEIRDLELPRERPAARP